MRKSCLLPKFRRFSSQNYHPKSFDARVVEESYKEEKSHRQLYEEEKREELTGRARLLLPPPNVTGRLHIGHALTVTIEDAITRHSRLHDIPTEWLPGFDHAGIATQVVVEKKLADDYGGTFSRHQLSRNQFVIECEKWSKRHRDHIRGQLNRLGASLDWDKEYYTLEDNYSRGVRRAFVSLHKEGLIHRSTRFVHWCTSLRSSISDQEVNRVQVPPSGFLSLPGPNGSRISRKVRFGRMYIVKYAIVGCANNSAVPPFLEVATTRPETLFADVAVAVHPTHPLSSLLTGRTVRVPLSNRIVPVVVDEAVLPDKGTGVLKITPLHDRLDASIASRHWQTILQYDPLAKTRSCISESGKICGGTPFDGIDRFDCREQVLSRLSSEGLLSGYADEEREPSFVSLCSRSGDVIEPRPTEQWFLDCSQLHSEAEKAIHSGKIRINPEGQTQRLLDWFSNNEPWCLSRQLLWGHRIPAFRLPESQEWCVASTEEEARISLASPEVVQDNDVLDTWFSSGLIPMICSGWMEGRTEWREPPISLMETGHDIIGFWVARMIILTMKLSGGQVPFSRVMLHGLVRDSEGRKMSKSLGNVIDPLDVIDGISLEAMEARLRESLLPAEEIEKALSSLRLRFPSGIPCCGTDSLRFALLRHDVLAADVPIDIATLAGEGLRFCNKLWNLVTYAEKVFDASSLEGASDGQDVDIVDEWIRSRLATTLVEVNSHMESLSPHLAFSSLHTFFLRDLADVYIETTKRALWGGDARRLRSISENLRVILSDGFRQLSVFMPLLSQYLGRRIDQEKLSEPFQIRKAEMNSELEGAMEEVVAALSAARSLKQQLGLPLKTPCQGVVHSERQKSLLLPLCQLLHDLGSVRVTTILARNAPSPTGFVSLSVPGHSASLSLAIQEEHAEQVRDILKRQLQAATDREKQFVAKAEKYEKLAIELRVAEGKKESEVKRNEKRAEQATRKALQARAVARGANSQAVAISNILENSGRLT